MSLVVSAAAVDDKTDDDDMEIEPTASPTLLEVVCPGRLLGAYVAVGQPNARLAYRR
jgi:hypothetical protein